MKQNRGKYGMASVACAALIYTSSRYCLGFFTGDDFSIPMLIVFVIACVGFIASVTVLLRLSRKKP
ncbi:hypothetical protein [Streptomyces sp. NPDC047046]|uniref:hypothetical protein n=1 Tax=Streptomyces sp. NPDC047046 TaxID=3155378 RepID=UPI0034036FB6